MLRRILSWLVALGVIGGVVGWFLTAPDPLSEGALAGLTGTAEAGQYVFSAAGCASCHVAPEVEEIPDNPELAGGKRFETQFGTFIAPNISPDPTHGIGAWSDHEIVSAIVTGVSPGGQHYYPAFPYTSYARADLQDMVDLVAYMRTLPVVASPSPPHEVGFPFNIRRSLGGWKLLFQRDDWVVTGDLTAEVERGRYLVEALGHCGECHTPRNALGGPDYNAWLSGAENPNGDGTIPDITPAGLGWSQNDIANYLSSGFTPDFDTAGGEMFEVIQNTSRLTDADRNAIAAYLVTFPTE